MKAYRNYARKGFTLVEILIVVIILGILAAIVIPQFTNASEDARRSSMTSQLQTLRSQIELFKLQHKDKLPGGLAMFNQDDFWAHLTTRTDSDGVAYDSTTSLDGPFGPYLQGESKNGLVPEGTGGAGAIVVVVGTGVAADAVAGRAYVYDYGTAGDGTGKIWAVEKTGPTTYGIFAE
ncbi:MAG: type II secretion system protein [Tepidisphaeraceae bacterium]